MNMVRFTAVRDNQVLGKTAWTPEPHRNSALELLTEFRKQYGDASYLIERQGDSKVPNLRKLTRFQIKDGEDVYYSREFEEQEVDARLAEIRAKWPQAEITAGVRNG